MTSVPTVHYFKLGRLGRGEAVRLFLRDAGIEFKDVFYNYDETWQATEAPKLKSKGLNRTGKLPVVEYKGHVLSQHVPILRFFARELGAYDGESNYDKHVVDIVSDVYIDWRSAWVAQLTEKTEEYKNKTIPEWHTLLDQYYSDREGPYLLGDKITYADFLVYQSIDNDGRIGTLPATLPASLQKLKAAIEARPNISSYIKENAA